VEAKRLIVLAILAVLPAGLVLPGLSDTGISVADTGTPNSGVGGNVSKVSSASASATSSFLRLLKQLSTWGRLTVTNYSSLTKEGTWI
jgi:hypothetical protein